MRARFVQGVMPTEQEALVGTVRTCQDATRVRTEDLPRRARFEEGAHQRAARSLN